MILHKTVFSHTQLYNRFEKKNIIQDIQSQETYKMESLIFADACSFMFTAYSCIIEK